MKKAYYVYILRCGDGSLYCGITTDVERRIEEHRSGTNSWSKYTRSRKVKAIEAVWSTSDRSLASKLEYAIKKLPRTKKEELICSSSVLHELFCEKLETEKYSYEESFRCQIESSTGSMK